MAARTAPKSHPDVEYAIDTAEGQKIFKRYNEAALAAVDQAMFRGESTLDILIYSEKGAKFLFGDEGIERYREDPDASVFERYEIKVNNVGRVS